MEPDPRIVPASALGDPTQLEPLARRIFGASDRPAGWFGRKLRRERVEPALSPVAIRAGADLRDPEGWLGYVLVGTPASLGDAIRTAGTGVRPSLRGRGIGGRLLDAMEGMVHAAGYRRVELLAEQAAVPFYLGRGFTMRHAITTALAFGAGHSAARVDPPPWRALGPGQYEPVAWLPEAWEGTEPPHRAGLRWDSPDGPVTAWVSREGVAWLVQRLVAPRSAPLTDLAAMLRARLPTAAPVVLPLLPAHEPQTRALLDAGWTAVQQGALLERLVNTADETP